MQKAQSTASEFDSARVSNTVVLDPTPEPGRNEQRLSVLTAAFNLAETKVNHIDSLRQNQMTIAMVIFAGLFGFGLKASDRMSSLATSIAIVVLMAIICALDRRLHKLGHGWRSTGKHLLIQLAQAVNDPSAKVSFERYRATPRRKPSGSAFNLFSITS